MPRFVDKQEKAAQIGSAAIGVFRKLGYHGTRMADIAGAAGIGKGTLYEYFRNKDEIFRSEFQRYFDAFEVGAAGAMAEGDSPVRRLLSLVRFAFAHVSEWEDHCGVYVDYFGSARCGDEPTFSLASIYARIEDTIQRLVEQGQAAGEIRADVEPRAMAELLVSVFDGIVLHGVFSERRSSAESLRDASLDLIARGLSV